MLPGPKNCIKLRLVFQKIFKSRIVTMIMFGNKTCSKCDKKIAKDFEFCPYCGTNFKNPLKEREEYGLIGTNDNVADFGKIFNEVAKPGILDKMLSSLLKNLEKEMRMRGETNIDQPVNNPKINTNFELFINGKKVPINQNSIQIGTKRPEIEKQIPEKLNEELIKQSVKLPRKEAKTKLTRLSNKVIYELDTPGLESLNQVLINKLEESIEIKAYAKKAVYHKNLSVKLPLVKYYLKEDSLFLEFQTKN